jgi:hypothetical protein
VNAPCILCGRATDRLVSDFWGVHAACEDLHFFEKNYSLKVVEKSVHIMLVTRAKAVRCPTA